MKKFLGLAALVLATVMPHGAQAQNKMSIAAVVNDEAISMTDVADRMKLVMASSGIPDNAEIRSKIMPQIVDGLIDEQLKLQAAKKAKLEVSDAEVNEGMATIAAQNKFTLEQFVGIMDRQGVPKNTLVRQIRAQLAWNKYVKEKLRNKVDVTETDVDMRIQRIKDKIGQTEYLVSEIYLPLDNPKRNAETEGLAQRMTKELQAGKAPFGPVAAQFSKGIGAEKGGSMGWIQQGHLEEALDKVLPTLADGQVSDPIKTQTGIHILLLQKKRTLSEESIPSRDELTNQIGFERLERVANRTLLDMKSGAFIDRRV